MEVRRRAYGIQKVLGSSWPSECACVLPGPRGLYTTNWIQGLHQEVFPARLLTTSGMGGPVLFTIIATLLCVAEGRPQSGDRRPVRPFSQSDSRDVPHRIVVPTDSQVASSPSRPHQTTASEDNLYQSRAHSAQSRATLQPQQGINGSHTMQHNRQDASRSQEHKRQDESPRWVTGVRLDPQHPIGATKNEKRGLEVPSPANSPRLRENRRSSPQEPSGPAARGQHNVLDRAPTLRMETVEVPTDVFAKANKEIGGGARRTQSMAGTQSSNQKPFDKEEIVFPGPTRDGSNPKVTPGKFAPQVDNRDPNCAQGSTFCESIDNYPSDYLKSILRLEADTFKEFFGDDVLNEINNITQRIDIIDENPLCPSKEQVVYPKMAQNKEDKWLFVVNQDQYVQGVRVEKCLRQSSECSLTEGFPLGYKTSCRQKYIYRRMLALNEDGKTHSDMFRLPSCCSCFVKAVGAIGSSDDTR